MDLDNPIKREDAIRDLLYSFGIKRTISAKYYDYLPFFDITGFTIWDYDGYIITANHLGIVCGDGNGKINPTSYLTRAEAVIIIERALGVENWEIPIPEIIKGLNIEYRGKSSQSFVEDLCDVILKYPKDIIKQFKDDNWKIVITDEDSLDCYDSKLISGLYAHNEKTIYIFTQGKASTLFFSISKSIAHEFAHYVHFNILTSDERNEIKNMFENQKGFENLLKMTRSNYFKTDEHEYWAEFVAHMMMVYNNEYEDIGELENIKNIYQKYFLN